MTHKLRNYLGFVILSFALTIIPDGPGKAGLLKAIESAEPVLHQSTGNSGK